jgi:GNAT superfamily N-acetyltransferase
VTSTSVQVSQTSEASRVREAGRADNSSLLELTSACPMEGDIGLCVDRSPDFFRLCRLGNSGFRVGVVDAPDGSLAGCATLAERRVWVGGQSGHVAYASDLKVHPRYRGSGAAPRLVRWVADRSRDIVGDPGPIVFTVLSGNGAMERLFAGERGLPRIDPFATLRAHTVPVFHRPPPEPRFRVEAAASEVHPELRMLWNLRAPGRQLAPLRPLGLDSVPGAPGGGFSTPRHFVARDAAGQAVGFLGLWDEQSVKQLRVTGYSVRLGAARTAINLLAPFIGAERLPGAGGALRSATVVDLCVPPDAPEVLRALLLAANRAVLGSGLAFLTIGLDVRDPLGVALKGLYAQPTDFLACVSAAEGRYRGPPLGDRLLHFEPALG